jgi:hypothetical protein
MKQMHINVQAKGGAGKSMLTYLQALKHEEDPRTYFVDFDSSVMTSKQQLQFLQKRKPPRFAVLNLLDNRNKIDRQLLFGNLQELSKKDFDTFYLDLGAPESDQLPSLFSTDYTIDEFCEIGEMLDCTFIFNVVVAGGGAYQACTSYLSKVANLVDGRFPVIMQINEGTFTSHPYLIGELERFAGENGNNISGVGYFGDFDANTAPHSNILKIISQGLGMEAYQFVERIKIKRELAKIQ